MLVEPLIFATMRRFVKPLSNGFNPNPFLHLGKRLTLFGYPAYVLPASIATSARLPETPSDKTPSEAGRAIHVADKHDLQEDEQSAKGQD